MLLQCDCEISSPNQLEHQGRCGSGQPGFGHWRYGNLGGGTGKGVEFPVEPKDNARLNIQRKAP